jgi:TRAP-type mannitol/chloroaromatic compound transport system permease small subunit
MSFRDYCTKHKVLFVLITGCAYTIVGRSFKGLVTDAFTAYGGLIFEAIFLIGFAFLLLFAKHYARIKYGE